MSDKPETVEIQLVPMRQEDREVLKQAIDLLGSFHYLLLQPDWEGAETIKGLQRIRERVSEYGHPYQMPMPMSKRSPKDPLFLHPEDEE